MNWSNFEFANINLSNCKSIHYKNKMPSKAWKNLKSAIINTAFCFDLTGGKEAKAIIFISKTHILVV